MSTISKMSFDMIHLALPAFPTAPGKPRIILPYIRVGPNSIYVEVLWPTLDENNLALNGLTEGAVAWKVIPASLVDPWSSSTDGADVFNSVGVAKVLLTPEDGGKRTLVLVNGFPSGAAISIKAACRS